MKDFSELYEKAHAAGMAAANACVPVPMCVVERANPLDDGSPVVKRYAPVLDGVCGFAWIKFKGNSAFGKWAKSRGIARSAYSSGLSIWVSYFNQSLAKKEEYAHAFAKVLRENGVVAYSESRMD